MADVRKTRVLTFDVGGSHVSAAVCLGCDYRLGTVVSAQYDSVQTSDACMCTYVPPPSDKPASASAGAA